MEREGKRVCEGECMRGKGTMKECNRIGTEREKWRGGGKRARRW